MDTLPASRVCCIAVLDMRAVLPVPHRWTLVHEGTPMRGPAYSELPATVRELSSSSLYGEHALQSLHTLGIKVEYSITRKGNVYK